MVLLLETNLDDLNPEIYEYVMERLFALGALDVYLTPIIMKKSRPGVILSVLCREEDEESIKECLFRETTTIGLRRSEVFREKLPREIKLVETKYGPIAVKMAYTSQGVNYAPEYESCRRVAQERSIPLKEVYAAVLAACQAGNLSEGAES
jgi:uncharacterized protein (DUF111 family)